ncbi:PEGA domain-containing protein [Lujinxingia litoralis]|nr:PEGA domain-containing protein [Lujinxingia litoralis]
MSRFALMQGTLLLAAMLLGSVTAQAQPSVALEAVVFEVEGADLDAAFLSDLSAVLRDQALQHPRYALVSATPLQRAEVAVVVGCEPETTECLSQIADFVEARVLISGHVRREGDAFRLSVSIFDRDGDKGPVQVERRLAADDPVLRFRQQVERVFAELTPDERTRLSIRAAASADEIRIDGVMVGRGLVERDTLPPGTYQVEIHREGALPYTREVELKVGEPVSIEVPAALASETPAPREEAASTDPAIAVASSAPASTAMVAPPVPARQRSLLGAYSSLGVGVVALGGAGLMVGLMRGVEDDIAAEIAQGDISPARYNDLLRRGESYETAQWVLLGVGVGATALGVGWMLVSYAGDEPGLAFHVGPGSLALSGRF